MPSKLNKRRKLLKMIMRSYKFTMPRGFELPLRLRPAFVILTVLVLLFLAFLGITNISRDWPLNGELLHFICFMVATGVFYLILDVDDDVRHILFWRYFGLGLAGFVCVIVGGIGSEFVKSLLPYKVFRWGDITANVLGALLGLFLGYRLEKYYRFRREVARLYQPLGESEVEEDSEEELLPTHNNPKSGPAAAGTDARKNKVRIGNVWDSREDFDIGSPSDPESEDEGPERRKPTDPSTPHIVVSHSS